MDLAVKLEAALVEYLQTATITWPDHFDESEQILPGESEEDLTEQYIRCRASTTADEESPLDTGNFFWSCEVEVRTPASETTNESYSQFAKHQAVASLVEDAILVDNLASALTTAAVTLGTGYELTVFAVQNRQPASSQEDDVYSSGWTFRVYCCSKAFS